MSLIKAFPEVELFFQNERFSQEELLNFIERIEEKYSDREIRKSVSSLIKLKILQYEISEEQNTGIGSIIDKTKKSGVVPPKTNRFHPLLESLKYNSIRNIASNIQWTTSRLIRLLEQKGILKSEADLLDEQEFFLISEMLNSRLCGLDRIDKIQNPIIVKKYQERHQSNQIDVYNKIAGIGLGKVIYIRKR